MMKVFWRFAVIGLGCGVLASSALAQNATIELKAVRKNGFCTGGTRNGQICNLPGDCPGGTCGGGFVDPVSSLSVAPNDRIVADVFARDWSGAGDRVRAYQLIVPDSFPGSIRGDVSIYEGPRFCTNNASCGDLGPSTCVGGVCTNVDARAGAVAVTSTRVDYVFFALSWFGILDLSSTNEVRFGFTLVSSADAVTYLGSPAYLGTVVFKVGPQMCGNATISLLPPPDSALFNTNEQSILPLDLPGLTLIGPDASRCSCDDVVDSDPPDCTIDARQTVNPDGTGAVTVNSIRLRMDCPDATSIACTNALDCSDILMVREFRPGGVAPAVTSIVVDPADRSWVTVNFSRALAAKKWTCTVYTSGTQTCLGLLAGDVDQDSLSKKETDLAALVNCMKQPGTCTLRECDTDRTGACTPADLLRVSDILAGGGAYAPASDGTGILDSNSQPIACP